VRQRDHLKTLGVNGNKELKLFLKRHIARECTELIWLRIRTTGEAF
jgi:hypothetical protein